MTLLSLLWSFFQVGLFSVGGGYAALPLIREQVVLRHEWLTLQEFSDLVTIAEMTPGPIAINAATFVGIRLAGIPGAILATLGCILPSLILVTILAKLYEKYRGTRAVEAVLGALRPVVVALIAAAGLSLLRQALFGEASVSLSSLDLLSAFLFAGALLLLRRFRLSPILTLLLCGTAGILGGLLFSTPL